MDLLSLPWWMLPTVLFVLPVIVALGVNRWRFHRAGVSACWTAALIVILQQVR